MPLFICLTLLNHFFDEALWCGSFTEDFFHAIWTSVNLNDPAFSDGCSWYLIHNICKMLWSWLFLNYFQVSVAVLIFICFVHAAEYLNSDSTLQQIMLQGKNCSRSGSWFTWFFNLVCGRLNHSVAECSSNELWVGMTHRWCWINIWRWPMRTGLGSDSRVWQGNAWGESFFTRYSYIHGRLYIWLGL